MTTALLLSSLICLLSCASPVATGKAMMPTPTSSAPTFKEMGSWYQLQMFDAKIGWAATANGLVRTTDGGVHWKSVFQCEAHFQPTSHTQCESSFDSATSATTTIFMKNAKHITKPVAMKVYHTSDGGQTWQHALVPAEPVLAHFVDSVHGWLIGWKEEHSTLFTLFRTVDAGRSWQELSPGPQISTITDITFQDATNAWITLTTKTDVDTSEILHSRDGGQHWQSVPIALPANQGISPIKFFSWHEGVFLVNTTQAPAGPIGTAIYTTHDGGTTWRQSAVAPYYLAPDDFINLQDVWTHNTTPGEEKVCFVSQGGGAHWTKISMQGAFQTLVSYSFVSTTVGFALGGDIGPDIPAAGVFKTTDGGHTWQELAHLV